MRNDNNHREGHEPKPYEVLCVIVGLFFAFTIVKLKGPNKTIKSSKIQLEPKVNEVVGACKV